MWREMDATKNSISMMASAFFTEKELDGKSTRERLTMLESKDVHWENLEHWLKKGAYFRKETVLKELSEAELKNIPVKHRPVGPVFRSETRLIELPKATSIANLADVLFGGLKPLSFEECRP